MESREIKSISIILPAYKQEKTIADDIKQLDDFLSSLSIPYELIVVIDGMEDATYSRARRLRRKHVRLVLIPKNVGKGYAVRYGMLQGKGDVIGFIDAGMDLDVRGIGLLLEYMELLDADIVIGSKLHPDSVVSYPLQRKIFSWGYRVLTRIFFGFTVRDTQVGLKLFRRKVVLDVFPRLVVKQFAFDVEVLAVAYTRGYNKIYEAPVRLTFNWGSTIANITSNGFWKVIFLMLSDTFAIFYRLKFLKFYETPQSSKEKAYTERKRRNELKEATLG